MAVRRKAVSSACFTAIADEIENVASDLVSPWFEQPKFLLEKHDNGEEKGDKLEPGGNESGAIQAASRDGETEDGEEGAAAEDIDDELADLVDGHEVVDDIEDNAVSDTIANKSVDIDW